MVSQFPSSATQSNVSEFLSRAGEVRHLEFVRDRYKNPTGIAFVEFYKEEAINKALKMSGELLLGVPVKIMPTKSVVEPQNSRRVLISDVQAALFTKDKLATLFKQFGQVVEVELNEGPRSAIIEMSSEAEANEIVDNLNGMEVDGWIIKVALTKQTSIVQPREDTVIRSNSGRFDLMCKLSRGAVENHLRPAEAQKFVPTLFLLLSEMFPIGAEQKFVNNVERDVLNESRKLGSVSRVWPDVRTGQVWVKFESEDVSRAARKLFHQRWYHGRRISARHVSEQLFKKSVPL